ncbi:MAG: acetolactate synthase small subunit [Aeromonadales bacterium]|nr:acetolactate synthase small subunit [Aeromonadales bacterium]MDY2891241.1 acetolactate synthase small subunit [Succinivibrio sp.]
MRQIISILLENETGALSRVVGLFSQRGYNIENITAAPTEDPSVTRITILTQSDKVELGRITKQLHKLVNVIRVYAQEDDSSGVVEREILFLKVQAIGHGVRAELKNLCDIFKAEIVDVTPEQYILQYVGASSDVDRFLKAVEDSADVIETVRSGVCGIFRGDHSLRV